MRIYKIIVFIFAVISCGSVNAADFSQRYPQLIDVMDGSTFLDTNNAGLWHYYPPLNLWTPEVQNVGDAKTATITLIHSHNIWSAYNMLQRNAMIRELREMKAAIQTLDFSVVVNVEGGEGGAPVTGGGSATLPDVPFGDTLSLVNTVPVSGFSGGVPPGFATYEEWTAYYAGFRSDMAGLDSIGRAVYPVAVQSGHMRYMIVQLDEVLTWQKVQTLAVCAVAAASFLGVFILAIKIKYPL